eukprot:CAMPEP_0169092612 /NCGR_PEP_ID=MMETSP1015-20121227/16999_1 /TAXON_ID=342587 /ORGANISM="Karlodinium micrum, Strain CCMP2283" /LENGTH=427 /DNA_ID=CAMNT_0009153203 /DNA_START=61 /DNA_END=1344 /DNA_ORIENTATION=-
MEARRSSTTVGALSVEAADKAIDDVALLEAALREAIGRKNAAVSGTPVGSPSKDFAREAFASMNVRSNFDGALASYSVQLKAWIDMQVDQRLNLVFRSALDTELAILQQDVASALTGVGKLETDIEVLKGTQAKMCAVVEGISQEMSRTNTAVSALEQLVTKPVDMESLKDLQARLSLEDLRKETTAAFQSEASAVASLEEQFYRLSQRMDQLAARDSITVIDRRNPGSPASQIFQKRAGAMDDVKETNVIHIKPPSPYGAFDALEAEKEAIYVERVVPSSTGVVRVKASSQPQNEMSSRTSRVRSSLTSNTGANVMAEERIGGYSSMEMNVAQSPAMSDREYGSSRGDGIIGTEIFVEEDTQIRRGSAVSQGRRVSGAELWQDSSSTRASGNIDAQIANALVEEARRNTTTSLQSAGSGRLRLSVA